MKIITIILSISLVLTGCAVRLTDSKRASLKKELEEMVKVDQIAASMPQGKYKEYTKEQWTSFKDSVFTSDKIRAEAMFKKYGFLGFDKVGKEGSNHFWLLVQHCDKYPAFQRKVLKAMDKEVKKDNANANNYAYLYDRVKVNAGEKQLFGTQVTYEVNTTGRAIPKFGLTDSMHVDQLRKEYDLGPLKEYLNEMTATHYEMNKAYYQKMGIMEPKLYE
ncbi:MAG: hypothetical protein JNL59_15730 [Chitinophagaceae bacterium]|nr:hypothetical protein [Chitinophagaceae bacterium]